LFRHLETRTETSDLATVQLNSRRHQLESSRSSGVGTTNQSSQRGYKVHNQLKDLATVPIRFSEAHSAAANSTRAQQINRRRALLTQYQEKLETWTA
jgi:hypothetical protein